MDKVKRTEIINKFARGAHDTGSSEVQIALLSTRIAELTEHFKVHQKDHHSRQGLLRLVSKRRSLIKYLKRTNLERHKAIISELGLRK